MDNDQLLRYSRHILLPQVDLEGQEKLQAAKVMIIGLGGLGSPVALYLTAAGVGNLVICDFDKVESSNLQRQILHDANSIGETKVASARQRLSNLNPDCHIDGLDSPISKHILDQELTTVDLVVDCTDNLKTRLMINAACVSHKTSLISGAAIRMEGQVCVFLNQGNGPCYQCLFPNTDELEMTCSEVGVLSTTVGIIGTLQAQEALKTLMGIGKITDGSLLLMDGMSNEWRNMTVQKRIDCPVCRS